MTRILLKNIGTLHTCDDRRQVLKHAYLVIDGNIIREVDAGTAPDGVFDSEVDLAGCIVMPGLVNIHHHFYQSVSRAVPAAQRGHLVAWLKLVYPIWSRLTPADLAAATSAACAELLLTGCTTTADHSYLLPGARAEYVDEEVSAALETGIRLHLVRGSLTTFEDDIEQELTTRLGARAGGLLDDEQSVLADMTRTARRYHDTSFGSRTRVGFGPTTVTYRNMQFMRDIATLATEFGCGLHTHFHPRLDEREAAAQLPGGTPTGFLKETGWLRPSTWFAHSTRLNDHEMAVLGDAGCAIAHCPRMILRLGARVPPIHMYQRHGIRVGVGVDGAASNDAGSMIGELRLVPLLHRLAGGEGTVPHQEWIDPDDALDMATRVGADILGRTDIGSIAAGMSADITAFKLDAIGYAGAVADPLAALLLAGSEQRAFLTMVDGRIKVLNGSLCDQDEHRLRRGLDNAANRILAEAAQLTGVVYENYPNRT
ncbi:amidohydrolase family protein [Bradyrhizobium sp. NP1]|uniref:amidohydrolase family protein n=1 Tax=Bradyrhizobium sp. NP1 TaxID=3049772 RepID=UPI0025A624FB|nr:amidohydrolase family protein [Bradyrhizobium sp. NP1]WJR80861.1 amidohydrolase family protein [Bradyrhizobium sp. NP1]